MENKNYDKEYDGGTNMTKHPLALQAAIPDKASAVAFSGGKSDSARIVLDLYAEDHAELARILDYRGERLIVTFIREEDVPHHSGQ